MVRAMSPRQPLPEHCFSRYVVRVRFCETDLMGIVHHAEYLKYFEAARVEYLKRRGVQYLEWVERGLHLPVVEADLRYKKTARFDDLLTVTARLSELTRVTVRFDYTIHAGVHEGEPPADALGVTGTTRLACVGDDHRPKRIPADVAEVVTGPETHPRAIDRA